MYRGNKSRDGGWRNHKPKFGGGRGYGRGRGGGRRVKALDVRLLVNKVDNGVGNEIAEPETRGFHELNLPEGLLASVRGKGYEKLTPIQDKTIDEIMAGADVLGIANTGTGKTGAFLIPILAKMVSGDRKKVLILAPTRELALQINREFISLRGENRFYSVACIGGASIGLQLSDLRRDYSIVVGTPGRVKDLMGRGVLALGQFGTVVLDEVDRMLDMGFVRDMRDILGNLPRERQSLFFSATVSEGVKRLIGDFSRDVTSVSVKRENTAKTIDQDVVLFRGLDQKFELLQSLLTSKETEKVLIFGRTKHGVRRLSEDLNGKGFRTESIHGNKSQGQRQRALGKFRQNQIDVLVATDVAARGLDIDDVTHVINYDMPETYDDYVHRIGRTGRANKSGKALTFVERR